MILALFVLSSVVFGQEKSNDDINRQIRSAGVDHVTLTFDGASNTTKIMAVSENFSDGDASAAGIQAMNFAMAFFYQGTALKQPPETIHFAFWVLTKKPRFAENHHLIVDADGRTFDLGDGRYAAKPNQNLEYLNFELKRADLAAMGSAKKVIARIGNRVFDLTGAQIKLIKTVVQISWSQNLSS
jgi:hypothetical protein